MQKVILRLQDATKQFSENTTPAVKNVSLTLQTGNILGLLGPSGCGKTTLLRIIGGFERPQTGIVEIDGQIVGDRTTWIPPEKRDIGIVFQDYALFPHLTVTENVAFGLKGYGKQQIQKRVAQALTLVRLEGFEKRYPYELSGGQQQRVALARALAPQPKLMLLDEPLSNLDIQVRLQLREEIRDILKAAGTSAIFVTHDQEEALAVSDIVGVMRQGHLEQIGTPEEIYTHPASRFVAEFVTQANFLPARRQGNLWETEIGCFAVKASHSHEIGEMMIRQEDFILKPATDAPVVIRTRRFLGREYRYCLQTPSGKELHARTMINTAIPEGTRVQLSIADDAVRIFPSK
ncbi:ABC transporter ATP-binding protein [Chlorogloeopsis fritschii PCC 9212]|uniref:ABC-type quaternary amine transporter n=1 Tax=Chlorogloeopsis fritschii PCC 6912 TaxID=211165 RepID=A0A3S1A9U5_CHLFR|nr:ABC transporter ATP-binding protein [Chlorogloeopsis fritschii]RUR86993.1 ABC transporter ATP-binding protein [Chlorogloeopsis fritschii PCC 6912]